MSKIKPWSPSKGHFQPLTIEHVPYFFTPTNYQHGAEVYDRIQQDLVSQENILKEYLTEFDLKKTLRHLHVPIMNIYGSDDVRVPTRYLEEMRQLNPKSILNIEISQSGHFPMIENPCDTVAAIRNFLKTKI